jgi:hypothetical protein
MLPASLCVLFIFFATGMAMRTPFTHSFDTLNLFLRPTEYWPIKPPREKKNEQHEEDDE